MAQLILMRHGQSEWNKRNLFTGWVDVPLSPEGIEEARKAGQSLRDLSIDVVYISTLIRGQMTAFLALADHGSGKVPVLCHPENSQLEQWGKIYSEETRAQTIPVYAAWQLNERMYGELQGLNKAETAEKFGTHQVQIWRRSYDVSPPAGESLKMTAERTLPFFDETIIPLLDQGKNVLISAHGNSLRSIMMELDELSEEQVVKLEIPTGVPIVYEREASQFVKKGAMT